MKILHIESSTTFLRLLSDLLSAFDLTQVTDFKQATQQIRAHQFDLIISAAQVNERGAIEFCAKLRQQTQYRAIPFIIYAEEVKKIQNSAATNGVSRLLQKSLLTKDLPLIIAELRDPPKEPKQEAVKNVLHIEDNLVLRILMKKIIESLPGYDYFESDNGASARENIAKIKPNIILLDINLPDTDGWTLAKEFRHHPSLKVDKIIAVSGEIMSDEKKQKSQSLFDAFLAKPFNVNSVSDALESTSKK